VAKLPTKVLCDTNFLLIPIRFGVDIFTESSEAVNDIVDFYVSSKVIEEIELLKIGAKPSFEKELNFALKMAEYCNVILDESAFPVDDSLISLAKKENMVIGTTDKILRKKARKANVKVIYLRQKRRLVLDS
jgi:uncharacterized protein